jgi:flagellar protein FlaH
MSNVLSLFLKRDELNTKLGNGMPKDSLSLIEGNDGGGKSIMAQRLAFGLLENGYTVTYISSELHTMGFIQQMNSLNYEVIEHILNDRLLFIPMFPYLGHVKLRKNFMEKMMKTKKIFEKDVIIIDTLSYLIVRDSISEEESFTFIKTLKNITSMNKCIILCVDPEQINHRVLNLIRGVADVFIQVEAKTVLGNLLRVASVRRFRRAEKDVSLEFPFKVEPGRGLTIEIAALS